MAKGFFGRLFGKKEEVKESEERESDSGIVIQRAEPEEEAAFGSELWNSTEDSDDKSALEETGGLNEGKTLEEEALSEEKTLEEKEALNGEKTLEEKEVLSEAKPLEQKETLKEETWKREEILEKEEVSEERENFHEQKILEENSELETTEEESEMGSELETEVTEEEPVKGKGFFKRLVSGLTKTRNHILSGINEVFKGFSSIDDDFYEELEEILVMADIGINTTTKILDDLKEKVKEQKIKDPEQCRQLLIESIKAQMAIGENAYEFENRKSVVMLIGVNGVGKTTSVGKLAGQLKAQRKKVLMAAADTFRAAAIEQLTEWSHRAGVDIIAQKEGSDPAAVVFDAVTAAKARNTDVLLCDTAGRLHNKKNLMEELKKIDRVITREYPDAYRETLVVLDGTTGQNALVQAREFSEVANITGIILTKMDGTAKGGIAIAIQSELGIPVKYIGIGEKIDDLQKFNADDFVNALFTEE
jgi:fused signal recognition particle receptor